MRIGSCSLESLGIVQYLPINRSESHRHLVRFNRRKAVPMDWIGRMRLEFEVYGPLGSSAPAQTVTTDKALSWGCFLMDYKRDDITPPCYPALCLLCPVGRSTPCFSRKLLEP